MRKGVDRRWCKLLGSKVLIVAFEGWSDAADASSAALRFINAEGDYALAYSVDSEDYYDFQYTRPQFKLQADGSRNLQWPEAKILRPKSSATSADPSEVEYWLLGGMEPALKWASFAEELIEVAVSEEIEAIIIMAAMLSDAPHSRPIKVWGFSESESIRKQFPWTERSNYEGPCGAISILEETALLAQIPTISLWASLPHYVSSAGELNESPKATLALLDKLTELCGYRFERSGWEIKAQEWESKITEASEDDDELRSYIAELERTRDTWDSPDASGDAIAQEFERFLRGTGRSERGKDPS